jgi:ribosomal protein L37E
MGVRKLICARCGFPIRDDRYELGELGPVHVGRCP